MEESRYLSVCWASLLIRVVFMLEVCQGNFSALPPREVEALSGRRQQNGWAQARSKRVGGRVVCVFVIICVGRLLGGWWSRLMVETPAEKG